MHRMQTHDMAVVDGKTGLVVGGDELDEDYNRCILPPTMADTQAGHRRSEESRKHRIRNCGDAPNAVTLVIQGARAVILNLISMQVTKVMSLRLRISLMVPIQHGWVRLKGMIHSM